MNFIHKLFLDKPDDETHRQLKRYGKGEYENKAVIDISKSRKDVKIKTSFEFAHDFIHILAPSIQDKTRVTGVIITTKDIRSNLTFEPAGMSQFAGVKSIKIDNDLSKEDILQSMSNNPDALFLLTFSTSSGSLKTKPKSPRSGKPSSKEDAEEVKADFCSFRSSDIKVADDFAFDIKKEFSKAFIKHKLEITDVVYPDEWKNDFAKIRELGKRKGTITREITVDGSQIVSKHDLLA